MFGQGPLLSIDNVSIVRSPTSVVDAVFTVTLNPPAFENQVTVDFQTVDGTAKQGVDYQAESGTLTLGFNVVQATVTVPILPSTLALPALNFTVVLSNAQGAYIAPGNGVGTGTITSGVVAGSMQFSQAVYEQPEFSGPLVVEVTRTGGTASGVTAQYATSDGTALAGVDYVATAGTVTFAYNQTTATITIPLLQDLTSRDAVRAFSITLSAPTGAGTIGTPNPATLAIQNPLVVTNTADAGVGSLRNAIGVANTLPEPKLISFAVDATGPVAIAPPSPLPAITQPVTIDGTTQFGFAGTPLIMLDGQNAGPGASGLTLDAAGATVRGLVIDRWAGAGVMIAGQGGDVLVGDRIGTDPTGSVALGNVNGVIIAGAAGNIIGGPNPADWNVISGNLAAGVLLSGSGASGNLLQGNRIGTDGLGGSALPNDVGVVLDGAGSNMIGGPNAGDGNVISGNLNDGVQIAGAVGNILWDNRIGVDVAGGQALGNGNDGVLIDGGVANLIGGASGAEGNVISGNGSVGVEIRGGSSTGNALLGNKIGTDATGSFAVGNGTDGVFVNNVPATLIGGSGPGYGNLISGNGQVGVQISGASATGNVLQGNRIGTDAAGTSIVANRLDGVFVNQAPGNQIGGTTPGAGNLISGNNVGLHLFETSTSGNTVQGNAIGLDALGRSRLGNGYGLYLDIAGRNQVGGAGAARNRIAGNTIANVLTNNGRGGPTVESVTPITHAGTLTSLVIRFSDILNPTTAADATNYSVALQSASGFNSPVTIVAATYNSFQFSVTLTLGQAVAANQPVQLTILGGPTRGVTDTRGLFLDGDNNGRPGGNFISRVNPV